MNGQQPQASKAPISLIDADPRTLTPAQNIQREIEIQNKSLAERQKEMMGFLSKTTMTTGKQ